MLGLWITDFVVVNKSSTYVFFVKSDPIQTVKKTITVDLSESINDRRLVTTGVSV